MTVATQQFVALAKVLPAPDNPRVHPEQQIAKLMDSMLAFGFPQPILVDPTFTILAGHGRLEAARKLYADGKEIPHVPRGKVPIVKVAGLTDTEARAYRVADNRLASMAGFDPELLAGELADLSGDGFDPALLGFTALDVARINEDVDRARLAGMAGEAEDPEPSFSAQADGLAENGERTVRLEIAIPAIDRQVVYDALVKARAAFGAITTGDALHALLAQQDALS